MSPDHREEALKAILHARITLALPGELPALGRKHLLATLEYAKEQVEQIQEVKRRRREPETEGL